MDNSKRFWILSGAFGGFLFALNLSLGAGLTYATGNPGFSGLITGLTTAYVLYMLMRTTKRFGAITIAFTLYCVLATPTVLMGAPGPYKILVGLACGLAFDLVLYFLKYKFFSFLIGFLCYVIVMLIGTYAAYLYLGLPQLDKFQKMMYILAAIFTIEGWLAAWLGKLTFEKRIKKLSITKKISLAPLD